MQSYPSWIWRHPDWPAFTFDQTALAPVLKVAHQRKGELMGRAAALGLDDFNPAVAKAWATEALATAGIEGEGLDPQSVRSSVAKRLGLDVQGAAPAARDVEGLLDVLGDASCNFSADLTLDRLCGWHAALFPSGYSGLHRIEVAKLRTSADAMQIVSGPVGRQTIHFQAPAAGDLPQEMECFLQWFNASSQSQGGPASDPAAQADGLVRAALAHLWFETLHPFDDGNGRLGRAIVQLALAQDAGLAARVMTLARQLEVKRDDYYRQLEAAQGSATLDVTPWVEWFIEQVSEACLFASRTMESSLQSMRFRAQHAKWPMNARQSKVLKKLLDAGPGGFAGGMTTRKYAAIAGVPKITAARDLIQLAGWGVLQTVGEGRSTRYYPNLPGWVEG